MTAQTRERWLKIFLPALFTAGAYVWFYGRPGGRLVSDATAAVERAREGAPKAQAVVAKQTEVDDLGDKLESEKQRQAALHAHATAIANQARTSSRSGAVLELSKLFAQHSLSVVSSTSTDHTRASGPQEEITQLCKTRGLPTPQFWRMELQGTYPAILNALKQLSARNDAAVPVLIEMNANEKKPRDPGDVVQTWTLVVWI